MAVDPSACRAKPSLASLQEQLDDFLAHVQRETKVPGVTAAVSIESDRVYASAGTLAMDCEEPFSPDTEFHLGCITKLFVAIVVLELARAKTLDLDLPIREYLPELKGSEHGERLTLSHLLSHTSGYRGTSIYAPQTLAMDWRDLARWLRTAPRHFEPGTVFSYEHTESVIAGEIVRRVTGKDSLVHVREILLEPLDITPGVLGADRGARQAGQHILDPITKTLKQVAWSDLAGAIPPSIWEAAFSRHSMSLAALLSVAEFAMGQSSQQAGQVRMLASSTLNLLQRPAVTLPRIVGGALAETAPESFGLGAGRWRDGFHGIGGSTYGQCQGFRFDARQGVAVAVGINVLQPYLRDLVIGRVCEALAGASPDDTDDVEAPFDLEELAGDYRGPGTGRVVASPDDGCLELVLESSPTAMKLRAELLKDAKGAFILKSVVPHLSVGFFREPNGDDVGLMLGVHAYKRVAAG